MLFQKRTMCASYRFVDRVVYLFCCEYSRYPFFFPRRVARVRARSSCGRPVTAVGTLTRAIATATRTASSRCRYRARHRAATSRGTSRSAARPWRPRTRRARPAMIKVSPPWTWTPSCVPITSARWNTPGHPLRRR